MGTVGKESAQSDSQYYQQVSFEINILVCGNYKEEELEKELKDIKEFGDEKMKYFKNGCHKIITEWSYYFFKKNKEIGKNTFRFIEDSILNHNNSKNLILFYSGYKDFTAKDLLLYYDEVKTNYHPNILIVEQKNEKISLPVLKKINKNFIRICKEENIRDLNILINIIEISSYYNQLGDEIGYPKKLVDQNLLEKDDYLITKYLFTINILLCGKPGSGKSTLINNILGKEKCLAKLGNNSITTKIVKYIHDKYPLVLYDSPGIETEDDVKPIQDLINEKNKTLNEEKNRIHCIFYLLNRKDERTFFRKEFELIKNLINQKMDIFIIITHSESEHNSEEYIEAAKIQICQNSNDKQEIKDLKKYIYPVELKNEQHYKKFGLKALFNSIYQKYKEEKILYEINKRNIQGVESKFLKDFLTKDSLKEKLKALSLRVKANFKLLAASLGTGPNVKGTTMLSSSVIKIISSIYNHKITSEACQRFIEGKGYTNELISHDSFSRNIEKMLASVFYFNGPASKEVNEISEHLIEIYSNEMNDDKIFYKFINDLRKSINQAIDSLQNINDD